VRERERARAAKHLLPNSSDDIVVFSSANLFFRSAARQAADDSKLGTQQMNQAEKSQ
jgi:hypothetical protein